MTARPGSSLPTPPTRLPLSHWGLAAEPSGLALRGRSIGELASTLGTPFFLFDAARLAARAAELHSTMDGVLPGGRLFYSVKTNPVRKVLETARRAGWGAEVISRHELGLARATGFRGQDLILNGPGKSVDDLAAGVEMGALIHVESPSEARDLVRLAAELSEPVRAGIRINPGLEDPSSLDGLRMGSAAAVFGLEPGGPAFREAAAILGGAPRVRLISLSAHIGTAIRSAAPFGRTAAALVGAHRTLGQAGGEIEMLDLGGGLCGPSELRLPRESFDRPALDELPRPQEVASFEEVAREVRKALTGTRFRVVFEPGRLLVGGCFHLVTRVVRLKEDRGRHFAVVDAGRFQNVRFLTRGYHEILHAAQPLGRSNGEYDLAGPLCAEFDLFARGIRLPALSEGDVLVALDVGAYNLSTRCSWSFEPAPVVALSEEGRAERLGEA